MIKLNSTRQSAFLKVSTVTLFILIIILAALFYYLTFNQVASGNASNSLTARLTAQSVMDKVDRNFYERFGDVQAYAYNTLAVMTAETRSPAVGLQEFMNTMTAYYVLYDLMMICDNQGNVLAVNTQDKYGKPIQSQEFLGMRMADKDWFKVCTSEEGPKGGAWFSDFLADKDIGKIYGTEGHGMAFAAPIRNAQGSVVGVWYNFASWKEVTDDIRKEAEQSLQKDHAGSFLVMLKNDGEVISALDPALLQSYLSVDGNGAKASSKIPIDNYLSGTARSKGAYTFAGKGWITVAFIPKEHISWGIFFSQKNIIAVLVCLMVVLIMAFYVYNFFKKNIINRIDAIRILQQRLSEGEIIQITTTTGKQDEFDQMGNSLYLLANNLKDKAAFADEISKGKLTATLENIEAKDVLGNSLLNMRTQLISAKASDDKRNWISEGLAQISTILRSYASTDQLYSDIIKFIVKYLNANQGGLFLVYDDEGDRKISLQASYAYEKRRFIEKNINYGDGLIGQCIIEGQTLYLNEIPKDFIHITSGLGSALPKVLLVVPLKSNGEVNGAIEIASFRKFESHEIEFVEKLAESISASLISIRGSENTSLLVTKLQQQTEEMRAQEEEMRQNMEELSATQEEMIRKEKEYIAQIGRLEKQR